MDEMFNKKPWIAPISTLDSGKTISVSSDEDYDNENNENIPPAKKSKLPIKRKYIYIYRVGHLNLWNVFWE